MSEQVYTPAEASAIVKMPLKAIHRVIDGRLIRLRRSRSATQVQRLLSPQQLVYLRLEAEGVRLLPMALRREVARAVESSPDTDVLAISGGSALVVQVKNARRDVEREVKRLRKVDQMVVSDPEIMGGTPVFRGTRVPVDLVASMRSEGATVEEIVEGYPALNREQIELAPLYVAAYPRRGRPANRPWGKQKPVRIAQYPRTEKA